MSPLPTHSTPKTIKTALPLWEYQWRLPLPTTSAVPRRLSDPTSPEMWPPEALSVLGSRGRRGTSMPPPTMVPQHPPPSPMATARPEELGALVSSASSPLNLCAGERMGERGPVMWFSVLLITSWCWTSCLKWMRVWELQWGIHVCALWFLDCSFFSSLCPCDYFFCLDIMFLCSQCAWLQVLPSYFYFLVWVGLELCMFLLLWSVATHVIGAAREVTLCRNTFKYKSEYLAIV